LLATLRRGRGMARPEQVEDLRPSDHPAQLALVLRPSLKLLIGVDGDAKVAIGITGLAEGLAVAMAVGDEDRVMNIAGDDHASWAAGDELVESGLMKTKGKVDAGDGHQRVRVDVNPARLLRAGKRGGA